MTLVASVAVAELPVQDPEEPDALPVTLPVKAPTNDVAVNAPDDELNVKFVPDLTERFPVALSANNGKQVVSLD